MGANHGADCTLDALLGEPLGHFGGDSPLLEAGGVGRKTSVQGHGGDGNLVSLEEHCRLYDLLSVFAGIVGDELLNRGETVALGGDLDLLKGLGGAVDGGPVHLDDLLALGFITLLDGLFDQFDRLFLGKDPGNDEEGGLHNRVDPLAQADLFGDLQGVDVEEADLLGDDGLLHLLGKVVEDLLVAKLGVEQKGPSVLDLLQKVVPPDVGRVVHGHEVGLADQVGRGDGGLPEAEVRDGDSSRLLGIVGEVPLGVHIRVVADDLDGVLVGPNGSVGSQPPEDTADNVLGLRVDLLVHRDGAVGHIVVDPDREVVETSALEVLEDPVGLGGGELLGTETVTASDDGDILVLEGGDDIHVERFADGTRLFGPVQDGDLLDRGGKNLTEGFNSEGPVESDLNEPNLLALGDHVVHGLLDDFGARSHDHDDPLGVRSAYIVEEVVGTAGDGGHLVHVVLDDSRNGLVILGHCLTALEVDVRVLGPDLEGRLFRPEGTITELRGLFPVHETRHGFVIDHLHLLNLMGGPETVEEVKEGDGAVDRRQMGDQGQVHDFLDGGGGKEGKSGVPSSHHVGVVTEDGEGLGRQGAGGDMEDCGEHLSGHLVHDRDHQQETLGRGKGRRHGSGRERTVDGTCGASFGLQLDDFDGTTEEVLPLVGRPALGQFGHWRGGSDRVDGRDFAEGVGHVGCCGIAVDGGRFRPHLSPLNRDYDSKAFSGCNRSSPKNIGKYTTPRGRCQKKSLPEEGRINSPVRSSPSSPSPPQNRPECEEHRGGSPESVGSRRSAHEPLCRRDSPVERASPQGGRERLPRTVSRSGPPR